MSRRRNQQNPGLSRRDFLWRNACAALTVTGMASTIRDLRLINAAAADSIKATPKKEAKKEAKKGTSGGGATLGGNTAADYKALVCVFLFGGNDGNNMIVPTDAASYAQYAAPRGNIAIPAPNGAGTLIPLSPVNNDGHTYGLNPAMPEMANLFNTGKAAAILNIGTLLAPITSRSQYLSQSVAIPPQLFSHSDQQIEWQTSVEDQPATTGWAGRIADYDLLNSVNQPGSTVGMNISLAGSNVFQTGSSIQAYNVSTTGAISLNISGSTAGTAQKAVLSQLAGLTDPNGNLIEQEYGSQMTKAIAAAGTLNSAILPTASSTYWGSPAIFPTSGLGKQLQMIARIIQAAPTLGHQRQIFFASQGGYDLHGTEGGVGGTHTGLLADLSACMNALYKATVFMGKSANVVQFTASDFSRTLSSNGSSGTDHGWGNHQFVVSDAVIGQTTYGKLPTLLIGGPDDTSTGRWIPTTSVDQYGATFAKWFGVPDANMATIFPYIGRFSPKYLPFL